MNRREIIKLVALSTGAALSTPLVASLVSGCTDFKKEELTTGNLLFFDQDEFDLITELVDLVLPRTESPSATDVGVHQIIDLMMAKTYQKKDQETYRKRFFQLQQSLEHNSNFQSGDNSAKTQVLNQLMASDDQKIKEEKQAFISLKQQAIAYYLSSEEVSKNHLNYLPVPGAYQPCISVDEVNNKAWAL